VAGLHGELAGHGAVGSYRPGAGNLLEPPADGDRMPEMLNAELDTGIGGVEGPLTLRRAALEQGEHGMGVCHG
jgi:hypothetical protein